MPPETKNFEFGEFLLDAGEKVLLRNQKPVPITPKTFLLLHTLLENHGHIVEKDALMKCVWADSFVEEGNLTFTVNLLRKALGDDKQNPVFIETIPRRGYRFIAEVSETFDQTQSNGDLPQPGTLTPQPSRKLFFTALLLPILILGLLAAGSWYLLRGYAGPSPSAPILSQPFKSERLTSNGNTYQAVISPNGKYVAYVDRSNAKYSLWLRQMETAENIQIVPPADVFYYGLAYSHDGNSIYFGRGTNRIDIYRVSAFGGIPVGLIEKTQGWISISPDDKQISFVRCPYRPDDFCSLFVADVDGKNERKLLTRPEPFRISDNQFSPDGKFVAFAAGQSSNGSNEFALSKIDLESRAETEITQQKFFVINNLKWLPNGSGLLITAKEKLAEKSSIWQVSAQTGETRQITKDGTDYRNLSLDAEARTLVATKSDNDFKIYLAPADDPNNPKILAAGWHVNFTPDGKIVYQSGDSDIWKINADGGEKHQLTNHPMSDLNPIVSADGRYVFFTSNRSGANQVWRMNMDGSDQRQLSRTEGGLPRFATPDGKWVYYKSYLTGSFRKVATDGSEEVGVPEIKEYAQAFSPDGQLIAHFFRDPDKGGKLTIGVRNLSDQALVKVLAYGDVHSNPIDLAWLPDNRTLNYVTESAGKYSLWRQSLDHDEPFLIGVLGTEKITEMRIALDGRSIATIRGEWLHDAILITGLR